MRQTRRKPTEPPEEIRNVSQSHFSVARRYGGCTFQGAGYHYDAETDTLVRFDVWRARSQQGKDDARQIARAERKQWQEKQGSLLDENEEEA